MGNLARLALLAALAALCSCDGAEPPPTVQCRLGADCDRKWSRALAWVAQNARYPIETQTDALIQTLGSYGKTPATAVTVYKVPQAGGWAEIVVYMSCANLVACVPPIEELRRSFALYVSGASPLVVGMPSPPPPNRGLPLLGDPLLLFQ
jgi:hypothetical protein